FFFSSRRRHTSFSRDWSSDVCSSDLHDIDARFELALHDVAGRRAHGVIEFLNVVRIILRLRRELPQLRRADDAADVGREDTVVKIGRASCREGAWKAEGAG